MALLGHELSPFHGFARYKYSFLESGSIIFRYSLKLGKKKKVVPICVLKSIVKLYSAARKIGIHKGTRLLRSFSTHRALGAGHSEILPDIKHFIMKL